MQVNKVQSNNRVNFSGNLKFTNLAKNVETNIATSKELDRDLYQKAVDIINPRGFSIAGEEICKPSVIKNYAKLLFENLPANLTEGIKLPDTLKECSFTHREKLGYSFKLPEQFKVVHYIDA